MILLVPLTVVKVPTKTGSHLKITANIKAGGVLILCPKPTKTTKVLLNISQVKTELLKNGLAWELLVTAWMLPMSFPINFLTNSAKV